ncbi:MAG TPA: immunoglobulin domain-containing protein [Holophagaceae bacterium]|nr:immunoglobulin domain-containing protein [Holophagaceae bacterium]
MSLLGRTSLQIAAGLAAITVVGCGGGGSSSPAPAQASTPVISTQPGAQTVVSGANATFTIVASGDGTLSYQWRKNGVNVAGGTSASLTITAATSADAGIYECVVTNTKGSSTEIALSAGAALSVNTAPVILAQPTNQAALASGSATFAVVASGNGTLSYQWKKDGATLAGATAASLSIPSVAVGDVGSYTCVVTNTLGSTTTTTTTTAATLSLATSPVIASATGTQTVAEGGNATFSVTASSTAGTLAYQWYKNGAALSNGGHVSGATSASLTLTGLALADAANYSCVVTNTLNGIVTTGTSNAAGLVVVATPVITAQPAAATFVQGQAGQMSVAANAANGTLSYQWAKDGSPIVGATAATYAVATIGAADAGSYVCTITNTLGGVTNVVTSTPAVLTVNAPVTITSQPASVTQIEGGATSLSVTASAATGTLSYQWKKNGADINGATASTLSFASLVPADAASYTCVVTRTLNGTSSSLTSAAAVLTVNATPVITAAPVAAPVATGSTATFSVTATCTPGAVLSYQWRKTLGGTTTNVGTNSNAYTTPSITGATLATYDGATYDCVITSTLNSTTTTTTTTPVALTVAVLPTVTIASSAGASPNNFTGGEAAPVLTATITNAAPALNGTPTYQWKKGGVAILGATSSTYTLPGTVTGADAGSYTCSVTNTYNGAVATGTSSALVMNVLAAPVLTTDLPAVKYQGAAAGATTGNTSLSVAASIPQGGTLSYQWKQSSDGGNTWINVGTNSASYSAPVSTATAYKYYCVITNTVAGVTATTNSSICTPALFQNAVITTQPAATNVVAGSPASLTVVPAAITIAGTVQTLQWYKGFSTTVGVAIPGATSATLSIPAADASDANYYYCIVTNTVAGANPGAALSTVTSSIVRLGVNTAPTIVTQPMAAPVATEGTSTANLFQLGSTQALGVVATGAPNAVLTYQWQKNGANIAGANGSTYVITSPVAADAGSYTCVVTSSMTGTTAQTVTSSAANLVVNQKPTNLTPVVTGSTTTGPVTLTVTPTNPNAGGYLTYQWKRNGTSISGAINNVYTINEITSTSAGNYTCDVSNVYVATGTSNASTATATSPIAAVGVGTGVTTPVITMGSTNYTAGKTGILISCDAQVGAAYEWSVTNGSITAGAGTNTITVTAGNNTALPLTATVVVTKSTGGAVASASATVVAAATTPQILAPASVHPGDTWMNAGMNNQAGTYLWTVTGAGTPTGGLNALNLPFSANAGAVAGDLINLSANVQNAAGDAAPTTTKTVTVSTGTWIAKDGNPGYYIGGAYTNAPGAAVAALPNGRVLVCGGVTNGSYTPANASMYDPTTGRWTPVAPMNFPRSNHAATYVPAFGVVLVTGGNYGGGTHYNNAEIYNPATNTWTVVATNMTVPRSFHTATLITSGANAGKIAIIGGQGSGQTTDITSQIGLYQVTSATTASFTTAPITLSLPRAKHTATALNDGRILVVGGQGLTNETYQQSEVVDLTASSSNAWTSARVGSLNLQQRLYHTATLLPDGKVLIAGGQQSPTTAELFNPADGTFTATTGNLKGSTLSANTGRYQHAATLLSNGKVLIAGGQPSSNGVAQSAELYDPSTGTFTSTSAPMNNGRFQFNMVALPNGTAMVVAGNCPNLSNTSTSEIFDPAANAGAGTWTTVATMDARYLTSAVRLQDGRVMVVGGKAALQGLDTSTSPSTDVSISKTTQIYNPTTGTWSKGPAIATARCSHTTVVLPNGKVLVAGGTGAQTIGGQTNLASAEIFDPTANNGAGAWTSAGTMNIPRFGHSMIALPDGKVLVLGGTSNGTSTNTAEIWDPSTNTWSYTNDGTGQTTLSEPKFNAAAVLLSNGKVVVAGGNSVDQFTWTAAVEIFDPATNKWTTLTPLSKSRDRAFPFALPNGKFVLLGGRIYNPQFGNMSAAGMNGMAGALEIYDTLANNGAGATVPTLNAFFKTESRQSNSGVACMLANGKILLAGGSVSSTGGSTSEIYDPATDTLTIGPALPMGQDSNEMGVTLANGDVMLMGGFNSDCLTQIYRP